MASLVSLLMTDIVGSTRRWAADDAVMAADLELHDRLLRDVVAAAGGSVVKHTGDGMLAVFDDPVAAVGAAAAIQRVVGDAVWRHADGLQVRGAVHTGTVHQRDDDVFGTAVNRVARLLGVCPPGAVLVSNAMVAVLADRAPEGLDLVQVGRVQLAGFAHADEVWAVEGPGVARVERFDAGPPVEHEGGPGGELPLVDVDLLGREPELALVWDELGRSSVVTLVGVGGMGKTRLALEVAHGAKPAFTGGVWWVDLTAATDHDAVVPVAMAAVGAREAPGRTPLQSLCDRFAGRSALVVFDNCEHVLGAARDVVGALVGAGGDVRVVCTSREALGLGREQIVAVGSLPDRSGVELFVERARAVRPDLDVDANRGAIERICARLDGIPLALELAAARCRSMTPDDVLARLDDRFRLLRGGRAGAERHRTLQAAVGWSYSLLDADERVVFDTLAVFAGGTLLDGLAAVTGLDEFDLLDIVDRLVARSMVVATATTSGMRYRQLETLRQYAEDRLIESGTIAAARERHLAWVGDLAGRIEASRGTPAANGMFRRFAAEVDNLRLAVGHAAAVGRDHDVHAIIAAVVQEALFLPAWDIIDAAVPLLPPNSWTDAAATCVGAVSTAALFRDSQSPVDPTSIPEQYSSENLLARSSVALVHIMAGRNDEALDVIDRVLRPDVYTQGRLTALRFMLSFSRQYERPLSDAELAAQTDDCAAAIARARSTGDDLLLGRVLDSSAMALSTQHPHVALEYAQSAVALAERLGASFAAELGRRAELWSLTSLAARGEMPMVDLARLVRAQVSDALDQQRVFVAAVLTISAVAVLADFEPTTAAVLAEGIRGFRDVPLVERLRTMGKAFDADFDEARRQAAGRSTLDNVRLMLAALDRLIAAESVGVERAAG
jgi:predicted ATPase/class 3 adenylate cyclase